MLLQALTLPGGMVNRAFALTASETARALDGAIARQSWKPLIDTLDERQDDFGHLAFDQASAPWEKHARLTGCDGCV